MKVVILVTALIVSMESSAAESPKAPGKVAQPQKASEPAIEATDTTEEASPAQGGTPTVSAPTSPEHVEAPGAQVAKPPSAPASEKKWQVAVGAGYMLATGDGEFDNASFAGGGQVIYGTGRLKYKSTYVLAIEGRFVARDSWGFIGGLNYEGERQLESGKLEAEGQTVQISGGSGASKVQFTTLYGSAVYRWNEFYLPFGLNFSAVKFKPAAGATAAHTESGGVGGQVGVGYYVTDSFALELYSWVTAMKLTTTSSSGTMDLGTGYFPSLILVGKYAF